MSSISKKIRVYVRLGILTVGLLLGQKFGQENIQAMSTDSRKEVNIVYSESINAGGLKRVNYYYELISLLEERGAFKLYIQEPKEDEKIRNPNYLDYAKTNARARDIAEADIIKNDGRYIYQIVDSKTIAIIDTKDQLKVVSRINSSSFYYHTMFLDNDKLIVLVSSHDDVSGSIGLQIYDIKDKLNPELIREIEVEGSIYSVRKINNTIYIMTEYYLTTYKLMEDLFYKGIVDEKYILDMLPFYRDSLISQGGKTMDLGNIWYKPRGRFDSMLLMTAIDINAKEPISVQALLKDRIRINMYMDHDSLYIAEDFYNNEDYKTDIIKYTLNKQNISYLALGSVPGTLNSELNMLNKIAMDEYEGNFRIVVTRGSFKYSIYVLDERLNVIGSLEDIVPRTFIYSVRLEGDKAYVDTFEQPDFITVIDLKDPINPKTLGKLKIPGYTQILH